MATTTPFMGLTNPVVSVTGGVGNAPEGQDYASDISGDLIIIDAHNHITVGQNIQTAAIDINADLDYNSNNIDNLRALRMISNSSNISAVGDIGCVYVVGNNLWYNNGSGSQIQLTNGSSISTPSITLSNYIYRLVTTNVVINASDTYNYFACNTAVAITITLPKSVAVASGTYYTFKDIGDLAQTNNITIVVNGSSSDLIDGSSSVVISTNRGSATLVADGSSNWYVLKNDAISLNENPVSTISPTASQLLIQNASANGSAWTTLSGDVSLSVTNIGVATVLKLQGNPVSAVSPSSNDSLVWSGSMWVPTGVPFSGDITGSSLGATVAALQGNSVANTAPTNGYVLTWNSSSSQWQPQSISAGSVTLSGDVTGAATSNTVNKIQGNLVNPGSLVNGQFLIATGSSEWAATSLTGDVSSSAPGNMVVAGIQGVPVVSSAPTNGYVLTYTTGTGWGPVAISAGSVSLSGDVTGAATSNTVNKIQGNLVGAGNLTKGQFLIATGTNNWMNTSLSGDVASSSSTPGLLTNIGLQSNAVATGSLVRGQFLVATGVGMWAQTTLTGDISSSTATGGALTVVALRGNSVAPSALTKGQFMIATGTYAWCNTTLSGDVSASSTTPGLITTVGLQSNTFTSGNPSQGQVVFATTTSNYGPVSITGDVSSSTSVVGDFTVVSLTGNSGVVPVATSGNIITWNAATTAPGIAQTSTSSATTAASMKIQAQSSTKSSSTGGNLILASGNGTSTPGLVQINQNAQLAVQYGQAGIQYGGPTISLSAGGSITLSASAYSVPLIICDGSLPSNTNLVFPTSYTHALWILDIASVSNNGHTLTVSTGASTSGSLTDYNVVQVYIDNAGQMNVFISQV